MDRIDEAQTSDLKYLNDFVLLDIGHPIHIYDNYGINSINLRNLEKGEIFTTLKNKEFICDGSEILIENNNKPACVAGIIGIEGFNENTQNVIIEAGYFLPENVNQLSTAAGKLFNLGVDFNQKTMEYVKTLINGDIFNIESLNKRQKINKEIILVYDNIFKISGFAISIKTIKEHLELYGFKCEISRRQRSDSVNNEFIIKCIIPSWRSDIEIEEDIVEEVLRIINIEKYLEKIQINGKVNNNLKYTDMYEDLRNKLINIGFVELYNFPFVSNGEVELSNSLNSEKRFLRNDFIETSINAVINTLSSGSARILAFEINKIYPSEEIRLGLVVCGESQRNWYKTSEKYDLFYLKKVLEGLSEIISIDFESIKNLENNKFDYGLEFSNGLFGKYKNINQERFLDNVFLGEFSISKAQNKQNNISQQKKYMDLSVSINESIGFDQISNILRNYNINYYVFDYYPNENCINYGITLIFDHEQVNNEEIYEEIKNKIEKLI
jgi:phenylalanyl-tRNA synthetase beta chain